MNSKQLIGNHSPSLYYLKIKAFPVRKANYDKAE
jgi:hypothetical protein